MKLITSYAIDITACTGTNNLIWIFFSLDGVLLTPYLIQDFLVLLIKFLNFFAPSKATPKSICVVYFIYMLHLKVILCPQ